MPGRQQIREVFKRVQQRCMNTAQRRLVENLPAMMEHIHEYAVNHQKAAQFSDMTGNWINSFGVALYRDGKLVAVSNMSGEVDEPIRTTLIDGDVFRRGQHRFDDTYQRTTFEIDGDEHQGSSSQYMANEEVLRWLSRSSQRTEGFSFRVVSVAEYHKDAAKRVLLQMSGEIEAYGGNIWQFHLG